MKKKPRLLFANVLIFIFFGALATATENQQSLSVHESLALSVEHYVENAFVDQQRIVESQNLSVKVSKIDPRIAISPCANDYQFDTEPDAMDKAFFSVRVSCPDNNWFIYASVRTTFTKNVVVFDGTVSPNTVLNESNVRIDHIDVNRVRHTGFSDISQVLGARMKYRVRDGQPVLRRMLCYVCEGDRITIAARIGSMEVKTSGIAQQDGTIGDTIEVTNSRSKKTVYAQVVNAQHVVVNL